MAVLLLRGFMEDLDTARPTRILDQHFGYGIGVEDLLAPVTVSSAKPLIRTKWCYRPCSGESQDTGSTVKKDEDKFHVSLDVQQFKPEEITVKVKENYIVVDAKHEERADEQGHISRHFTRRYLLPEGYDLNGVASTLSSEGILSLSAPKIETQKLEERIINIAPTGPHRVVEDKADGDKKEAE